MVVQNNPGHFNLSVFVRLGRLTCCSLVWYQVRASGCNIFSSTSTWKLWYRVILADYNSNQGKSTLLSNVLHIEHYVQHIARYWQTTLWQTIQKTKLVVPTCKQPSCQIQVGFVGQGSHWQSYFLLQGLLGYGPVGSCCSAGLCPSSVNQNMRTKWYVFESQPKQRKGSMCACVCVNNVNCYHSNHHAAWSKAF